jgi:hypothetical protein
MLYTADVKLYHKPILWKLKNELVAYEYNEMRQ